MVGMARGELYIGLMSGTSLDGVDGVVVEFTANGLQVIDHHHQPFPEPLRQELLALNLPNGTNELHRCHVAAHQLVQVYSAIVQALLVQTKLSGADIRAIGAHGQTVRHMPCGPHPYTVQLNNPALLAELTGIDVVADFRSRDVAAGGQGAPLVPAFHHALFHKPGQDCAVLNLGGISNITLLSSDGMVNGFDCGPANVLMDLWCQRHTGKPFDTAGQWGATGQVLPGVLAQMLAEPYFALPAPKSTGRDLFHAQWLDAKISCQATPAQPQDVQATLCELTAISCAQALTRYAPHTPKLLVCGGGAFNQLLMHRLSLQLPQCAIAPTDTQGLPAMQVEATAFAWLAHRHVHSRAGNLAAVTGALGPRLLGALYPADMDSL
jgi:anhydro-N-acetylmuramic acid kinase